MVLGIVFDDLARRNRFLYLGPEDESGDALLLGMNGVPVTALGECPADTIELLLVVVRHLPGLSITRG